VTRLVAAQVTPSKFTFGLETEDGAVIVGPEAARQALQQSGQSLFKILFYESFNVCRCEKYLTQGSGPANR
jgi:hypothetical protein